MSTKVARDAVAAALAVAGFIAADEEADELIAAARGDGALLDAMLERRLTGEPLAWITGDAVFCGVHVRVDPGVYVPRWHSEQVALRGVERLPERGLAIDICTGTGAIAKVLRIRRPRARVVAGDVDARAVACATSNGVEAYAGDLFAALPGGLAGRTDVITAVVPYVPDDELHLLQRDTFSFETELAYDGGAGGLAVLTRVVRESPRFLRRGGCLLLELGGDQAEALGDELSRAGFAPAEILRDEEGDVRGFEALLGG